MAALAGGEWPQLPRGSDQGSITPGKLADFVVLSDDLFPVAQEKIKDLQFVRTVMGGITVY
jgi:predicted amidohydrolase YtcJ